MTVVLVMFVVVMMVCVNYGNHVSKFRNFIRFCWTYLWLAAAVTKKMEKCKKSSYSKRNRRFCKKAKRKMSGKKKCCKRMKVCEDSDDDSGDSDDSDDSDDDSSQPPQPIPTPSSTTTSGDNGRKWVCEECPGKVLLLCFDFTSSCLHSRVRYSAAKYKKNTKFI